MDENFSFDSVSLNTWISWKWLKFKFFSSLFNDHHEVSKLSNNYFSKDILQNHIIRLSDIISFQFIILGVTTMTFLKLWRFLDLQNFRYAGRSYMPSFIWVISSKWIWLLIDIFKRLFSCNRILKKKWQANLSDIFVKWVHERKFTIFFNSLKLNI